MLSGQLALISGITVFDFEHSLKADTQSFVNSGTSGATGRRIGNKDWSGSYSFHGHTPPLLPGATDTIIGDMGNGKGITGPIICDECTIKWDIEGGRIIEGSSKFSGNGAWTLGSVTSVADASIDNPPTSIGCKVHASAVTPVSWAELLQVRTIELTLKRDNKAGAHSGTSGFMNRRIGNLDASVAISVYFDDPSTLIAPNTDKGLRLYVDDTLYWEILWATFGEISGWKEDIQTAALVGCTLNAGLNALPSQGTMALGSIKTPAGATIWP